MSKLSSSARVKRILKQFQDKGYDVGLLLQKAIEMCNLHSLSVALVPVKGVSPEEADKESKLWQDRAKQMAEIRDAYQSGQLVLE